MKTMFLTSLLMLVVACSGGQTTGGDEPGGESKALQKKAAAEAHYADPNTPVSDGDVCADKGWYGDDECDTFCRDHDSYDCSPDNDGVVCAAFIEAENGYCSRRAEDPCISQDPDCAGSIEPSPPDPGILCTAIALEADGMCPFGPGEVPADPCLYYQDPDCISGGNGSSPTEPTAPACEAVPDPSDGTCSRKDTDPCRSLDPDCEQVACAEYIEISDGVCKREPSDPCIFQDPDCHVK